MSRSISVGVIMIFIAGAGALLLLAGQINPSASPGSESGSGPAVTPTMCPQATPEAFWVDPVVSPTAYLTQTILVYIGQGDWARVSLETGVYTYTGSINLLNPAPVGVVLDPDTTHHLTASAHVPVVTWPGGCQYGGYILSANVDKDGNPLTIVQVSQTHNLPLIIED